MFIFAYIILNLVTANIKNVQGTHYETDETRLFDNLFKTRQINSSVRPVVDKGTPVQVTLDLAYVQLVDLSDKQQILKSSVWIRQEWMNEFLRWEPSDYGDVTSLTVDKSLVWKPDLVLYNNAEEGTHAGVIDQFKTRVVIFNTGVQHWYSPAILTSVCSIDISYFPFDYQTCILKFGSWTYLANEINLTNKADHADTSFYAPSSQFSLLSLKAKRQVLFYSCCPDPFINIDYQLELKREPGFYLYNIIVPAVVITGFALCVFLFPEQTGSRMSLVFDCFLTLSIIAMMVSSLMPNDSTSTPLIATFMLISMVQVTVAAFMTAACHNLDRETPIPFVLKHIIFHYMAPLLFVTIEEDDDEDDNNDNDVLNNTNYHSINSANQPLFLRSSRTCDRLLKVLHNMEGTNSDKIDYFGQYGVARSKFSSFDTESRDSYRDDFNAETSGLEVVKNLDDLVRICLNEDEGEYNQDFWRCMSQIFDRLFFMIFFIIWSIVAASLFLKVKPSEAN